MTVAALKLRDALPPSLPPRGLRRTEAAAYIGVSPSTFDKMVVEGVMPKPKRFGDRVIWDRHQIDEAFETLAGGEDDAAPPPAPANPWDEVSVL